MTERDYLQLRDGEKHVTAQDGQVWVVCIYCGVRMRGKHGLTAYVHADDCPVQIEALKKLSGRMT